MDDATYYKLISAMGKEVMWEKKAKGETMHLAPLGWKNVRRRGRSVIIRDHTKYRLIQEAKRLHKRGKSIRYICLVMDRAGLRSQRGNAIGPSGMYFILSRDFQSA